MPQEKRIVVIIMAIIISAIILSILFGYQRKIDLYQSVQQDIQKENWSAAKYTLTELGEYKDSNSLLKNVNYHFYLQIANENYGKKDYKTALMQYELSLENNPKDKKLEEKIKKTELLATQQTLKEEFTKRQAEENKKRAAAKAKIHSNAIYPIPTTYGKGYDKTISRYGVATIKRINSLMPKIAELVSQNPSCDMVNNVDVSDQRSTKNNIVMYADCDNFERFYMSEKEIKANAQSVSIKEQMSQNQDMYLKGCEAEIKSRLNYPSTYKTNTLLDQAVETESYQTTVRIDFKAKNAYGLETQSIGLCRYNAQNKLIDFSITEKR